MTTEQRFRLQELNQEHGPALGIEEGLVDGAMRVRWMDGTALVIDRWGDARPDRPPHKKDIL